VIVGERGPEMVDLPGGSWVHTADETAQMMRDPVTKAIPGLLSEEPTNDANHAVDIGPAPVEDDRRDDEMIERMDATNERLDRMLRAMVAKGDVDSQDAQALRREVREMRRRQRRSA